MILITGANRGIGAALLAHYRAAGEDAAGTARTPDDGLLPLDVTDPGSLSALGSRLAGRPLDILICNAGIYLDRDTRLGDYDPSLWARTLATNAAGPFLTVQALLPNLLAAAPAKVAIIASGMGSSERAAGDSYAYRASKAAAINVGRSLAAGLKGQGIAVGVYHPGWVRTGMTTGSAANVEPADSAAGLAARIAALGPATSGVFETYHGRPLPF